MEAALETVKKPAIIFGDLDLPIQCKEIPANTEIRGHLYLSDSPITELPENLTCEGLHFGKTCVTKLSKGLTVKGNLDLRNTKIKEIPENMTVYGNLNLDSLEVTEIPASLKVGGDLITSIAEGSLPEDFTLGGNLVIVPVSDGRLS